MIRGRKEVWARSLHTYRKKKEKTKKKQRREEGDQQSHNRVCFTAAHDRPGWPGTWAISSSRPITHSFFLQHPPPASACDRAHLLGMYSSACAAAYGNNHRPPAPCPWHPQPRRVGRKADVNGRYHRLSMRGEGRGVFLPIPASRSVQWSGPGDGDGGKWEDRSYAVINTCHSTIRVGGGGLGDGRSAGLEECVGAPNCVALVADWATGLMLKRLLLAPIIEGCKHSSIRCTR